MQRSSQPGNLKPRRAAPNGSAGDRTDGEPTRLTHESTFSKHPGKKPVLPPRFLHLFDNLNDAVFAHDLAGHLLEVNRTAWERLGYTRAELLRMRVQDLLARDSPLTFDACVQAPWSKPGTVVELLLCRKNGRKIPVEVNARLVEYDGQPAILAVARDIQKRKQLEAELGRRNAVLERIQVDAQACIEEIAASNEVVRRLSPEQTAEQVFQTFARHIVKLVLYDWIAVTLYDPRSGQLSFHMLVENKQALSQPELFAQVTVATSAQVRATRQAVVCPNLLKETRFPQEGTGLPALGTLSCMSLPLLWRDKALGVLSLGNHVADAFHESDMEVLLPVARQLALAIENIHLQEQLSNQTIRAERDRLGRELHDGLAQLLGSIGMKAAAFREYLSSDRVDDVRKEVEELDHMAQAAYADLREAILGLRSSVAEERDLQVVLQEYLSRYRREWGIQTELVLPASAACHLTPSIEMEFLRIIQESLTNVRKHAQARRAWISFSPGADGMEMTIRDDGVGFDVRQCQGDHFGLQVMQERAESIGGEFRIESAPSAGTRVRVWLPNREIKT